jgi:CheY-like chemotaxis protein
MGISKQNRYNYYVGNKLHLLLSKPKLALIVDDNEDSRIMMKCALEWRGFRVLEAMDGKNAVSTTVKTCPDIILMDICLPYMDGLEVIRHIRKSATINSTPIVVISGYSTPDFLIRARDAGCDEYLCKPIDFEQMDSVLNRLLFQ